MQLKNLICISIELQYLELVKIIGVVALFALNSMESQRSVCASNIAACMATFYTEIVGFTCYRVVICILWLIRNRELS